MNNSTILHCDRNISALPKIPSLAAYKRAWRVFVGYAKRIRETSFASLFEIGLHIIMRQRALWYAGISKRSQRGGLENRLPKRHGGSNPSSCAIKTNTIPRGWCLFLYHSQRGRTRRVRIPQAQSAPRGTDSSRYLRREEISAWIYTQAEQLALTSPRAAYPSSCAQNKSTTEPKATYR